jgi:hypothetical protein
MFIHQVSMVNCLFGGADKLLHLATSDCRPSEQSRRWEVARFYNMLPLWGKASIDQMKCETYSQLVHPYAEQHVNEKPRSRHLEREPDG